MMNTTRLDPNANTDGALLDFGNDGDEFRNYDGLKREIFWGSPKTIMLGEPNPWLEVDANGNITKIVNVEGVRERGPHRRCASRTTRSPTPTPRAS